MHAFFILLLKKKDPRMIERKDYKKGHDDPPQRVMPLDTWFMRLALFVHKFVTVLYSCTHMGLGRIESGRIHINISYIRR